MMLTITDITSAMGKDHQTIVTSPVSERRYAAGISTTSCLAIDTNME